MADETISVGDQKQRIVTLDVWRGVAIALMILDHVCAALEVRHPENPYLFATRLIITRPAMPLFMLVSGYLMVTSLPSARRIFQVAAAAVLVNVLWFTLPMGTNVPDILVLWLMFAITAKWWTRFPVVFAAIGLLQTINWEIPWDAYQPGYVLTFLCLGVLAQKSATPIPSLAELDKPFAAIGRHPLGLYVAHIVLIAAAVTAFQIFG
jgi:uncharacterized membrane protein